MMDKLEVVRDGKLDTEMLLEQAMGEGCAFSILSEVLVDNKGLVLQAETRRSDFSAYLTDMMRRLSEQKEHP
jgi:hypothetical protein